MTTHRLGAINVLGILQGDALRIGLRLLSEYFPTSYTDMYVANPLREHLGQSSKF